MCLHKSIWCALGIWASDSRLKESAIWPRLSQRDQDAVALRAPGKLNMVEVPGIAGRRLASGTSQRCGRRGVGSRGVREVLRASENSAQLSWIQSCATTTLAKINIEALLCLHIAHGRLAMRALDDAGSRSHGSWLASEGWVVLESIVSGSRS